MSATVCEPWLSVVMPSHRGEQWIDASLRSLASEAVDGIEVLVLDSSPTSATLDIARSWADRLDLHIFECRDHLSWQSKTNIGVERTRAPYVCLLHQDDLWFSGRTAAVRSWIEAAPHTVLHLAPSAIIDRNGRTLGRWRCPLPANRELPPVLVMERLLVQNFISTPAPVFRKDAWRACGGLDEALWYTADWDIWLKLAAGGGVCYHDTVTTGFRVHGGSLTVTGSHDVADFARQMQIVLDRHLPRLGARSKGVERIGRASIAINTALAAASAGEMSGLLRAVATVVRLGPVGVHRYLRDSRIVERVAPRVRAKLVGAF